MEIGTWKYSGETILFRHYCNVGVVAFVGVMVE